VALRDFCRCPEWYLFSLRIRYVASPFSICNHPASSTPGCHE